MTAATIDQVCERLYGGGGARDALEEAVQIAHQIDDAARQYIGFEADFSAHFATACDVLRALLHDEDFSALRGRLDHQALNDLGDALEGLGRAGDMACAIDHDLGEISDLCAEIWAVSELAGRKERMA